MPGMPKPNHRALVDACYPPPKALVASAPEYRPNSNELGKLEYYASNKPAKLLKVGHVLAERAKHYARQLARPHDQAKAGLMITLAIAEALVKNTPLSLNYFEKPVQAILLATLGAARTAAPGGKRDIELTMRAASAFYIFSTLIDPQITILDSGSRSSLGALLVDFAALACADPSANLQDLPLDDVARARLTGLAAIRGLVSGELLYGSTFSQLTAILLPSLLVNLTPTSDKQATGFAANNMQDEIIDMVYLDRAAQELAPSGPNEDLAASAQSTRGQLVARTAPSNYAADRVRAHTEAAESGSAPSHDPTLSARSVTQEAMHILHALLSSADAGQLQVLTAQTLDFIEGKRPATRSYWRATAWCTWLAKVYVLWTGAQYRCTVVHVLADRLMDAGTDARGSHRIATEPSVQQVTLVTMIKNVLESDISLIGLATSELVDNFLGLTIQRVHADLDDPLLPALVRTIGALSNHVYYAEQMADIAEEISERIEVLQRPESDIVAVAAGETESLYGGHAPTQPDTDEEQQKDESIRVLLYALMATLRNLHADTLTSEPGAKIEVDLQGDVFEEVEDDTSDEPEVDRSVTSAKPKASKRNVHALAKKTVASIPLNVLHPISGLLAWPSAICRLAFAQTLVYFLRAEPASPATSGSVSDLPLTADLRASVGKTPWNNAYLRSVEQTIGTLHAVSAGIFELAIARALFVPDNITSPRTLDLLVGVEGSNGDVQRPIVPDFIASANPVDYGAIKAILENAINHLPVSALLALLPMLMHLEDQAPSRLASKFERREHYLFPVFWGGIEAQRLYAIKGVILSAYALAAQKVGAYDLHNLLLEHLQGLPPAEIGMPVPPENLEPPEDVSPFPPGDAPAAFGEKVLKMLPVISHETLISEFSQSAGLQAATTLSQAQLSEWFRREWSVEQAVADSFNGTSPLSSTADDSGFGTVEGLNLTAPTAYSIGQGGRSAASVSILQPHLVGGGTATARGTSGESRASRSMGGASMNPSQGRRSLAPSVNPRNGGQEPGGIVPGSIFQRVGSGADAGGTVQTTVSDLRSALAGAPQTAVTDGDSDAGSAPEVNGHAEQDVVVSATNGHRRSSDVASLRSSIRGSRAGSRLRNPSLRRSRWAAPETSTVSDLLDSLQVSANHPTIPEDVEVNAPLAVPGSVPVVLPHAA